MISLPQQAFLFSLGLFLGLGDSFAIANVLTDQGARIEAATETRNESHSRDEKKSGLFSNGSLSFTLGKQQQTSTTQTTATLAAASTLGSTGGDIGIQAEQSYRQSGSDLTTPQGNIDIQANRVQIEAARETQQTTSQTQFKQSGLTLSVTNPVISAVQTGQQMSQAVGNTGDGRMQVLAATTTGLAARNTYDAVQAGQAVKGGNLADQLGGVNVSLSLGSSQSQSSSTQRSDTARGSQLQAGGDIAITATAPSPSQGEGDLRIQGSQLQAGNDIRLSATNQIDLQAAQNTNNQQSNNRNQSASIGIGFGLGQSGAGASLTLSASQGKGHSEGQDLTWTNSQLQAGNTLDLTSGGDTKLQGAIAQAQGITAAIGGNLQLESQQDQSSYNSREQNLGGSLSIPLTPGAGFGASLNAGKTQIDSTYASGTQQTGFQAGDQGFQIDVGGNTDLQGAIIASTDPAVEENRNRLTTATLSTSDIENQAEYQADSTALSAGVGSQLGGSAGTGSAQGQAESTSRAGVSGIAGNQAVRTGDGESGIQPIFDADKVQKEVQAQVAITQAFGREAPKAVASYATDKAKELRAAGNEAEAQKWEEGGIYRIALHTAVGAMSGGLEGAAGAATVATVAPLLDQLQTQVKANLEKAGLSAEAAKLASQALAQGAAAGIGTVASGGSATGAAVGFNLDTNNRQLHPDEEKWLKDKAKRFAQEQGITEEEALARLTQQALREVDYLWRAQLADGDDATAKAFIVSASDSFTNDLGEQQRLFTTQGQQLFRPEMFGDSADPAFYKQFAQSGINRDLTTGLLKELRDSGVDIKDAAFDLAKAAKDNPDAAMQAVWAVVKDLPGTVVEGVVEGFKETGTAIGEGSAVAFNDDINAKLNAIYGVDVSTAQKALLAVRVSSAILGAAGEKAVEAAEAIGQQLDETLNEAAHQALLKSGGVVDPHTGEPILDLKQLTTEQKGAFGELFGENLVKQIVPDGQKLARSPGIGETGIDDLYKVNRPDVDYVHIEYKFVGNETTKGSSRLGDTQDGKQGSESWMLGSGRLAKAVGEENAIAVEKAVKAGRAETWVVTTRPGGATEIEVLDAFGKPKPIDTSKILPGIDLSRGVQP